METSHAHDQHTLNISQTKEGENPYFSSKTTTYKVKKHSQRLTANTEEYFNIVAES